MIISTGMRTDIPAFYSQWLLNRIKAGYVCVRNPYNPNTITKYLLDPKVVDCMCFCTKNPAPLVPHLKELAQFKQFWFVTINGYGKNYEPNVPPQDKVIEAFASVSRVVGSHAIGWRYDPIFYGNGIDEDWHVREFTKIATALKGYTDSCVISFLDLYEKVKRNAPNIYPPSHDQQFSLAKRLVKIAKDNGITIRTCCEGTHLAPLGIDVSGCQNQTVIERAIGEKLSPPNHRNARAICPCLLGNDIGAYNTCAHLCKYCYANMDKNIVLKNIKQHNPASPLLIGELSPNDKVVPAKQQSWRIRQTSIF